MSEVGTCLTQSSLHTIAAVMQRLCDVRLFFFSIAPALIRCPTQSASRGQSPPESLKERGEKTDRWMNGPLVSLGFTPLLTGDHSTCCGYTLCSLEPSGQIMIRALRCELGHSYFPTSPCDECATRAMWCENNNPPPPCVKIRMLQTDKGERV